MDVQKLSKKKEKIHIPATQAISTIFLKIYFLLVFLVGIS